MVPLSPSSLAMYICIHSITYGYHTFSEHITLHQAVPAGTVTKSLDQHYLMKVVTLEQHTLVHINRSDYNPDSSCISYESLSVLYLCVGQLFQDFMRPLIVLPELIDNFHYLVPVLAYVTSISTHALNLIPYCTGKKTMSHQHVYVVYFTGTVI